MDDRIPDPDQSGHEPGRHRAIRHERADHGQPDLAAVGVAGDDQLVPERARLGRGVRRMHHGQTEAVLGSTGRDPQVVPADAGGSYQLAFSVRTENLRTGGPPLVEVTDCRSERVLSASEPFTIGTSDWLRAGVQFTVPDDCSAVIVRTARLFCGEECPINGTFWYDDFTLSKQ